MPMDFPDMNSLKMAAKVHKFRQPDPDEHESEFRRALADHVRPIDFIESEEIRNGVGWDKFTSAENAGMLGRAFFKDRGY